MTQRPCQPVDPPEFGPAFRKQLEELLAWRRDVRRFTGAPMQEGMLRHLIDLAVMAPSVGNSQPWRFVEVVTPARRQAIIAEFERCNAEALKSYTGDRASSYATLKLAGLRDAPAHIAVFNEDKPLAGYGLGRRTMPETLHYSTLMAIHTLWLAARAEGLGMGWVSILDPERVKAALDVPPTWSFIAYLCIGEPCEEHLDPELVRHGWQETLPIEAVLHSR
ncbi:MAG: 5,6-dimethylbenzimidazole synthase [Chelatococcus sp.]|jgi:5,6-dimethylbenzimidazole synthase|uniref:5,6-dimethylbenzimidazole synthase n=1 Tax=unclassified Chelatococcus TaxID=2638111 RepID=UPI001BCCA686|nr:MULTISPECIES: 5,6-dimethylbenzimidazole synthase [unclassified Chelatococcus]CAH1658231.1 5,6-dimethylbenzimidazole synthase [Hyphomicrobiales bacterium]MBS7740780.1 5,6-dimethylbenzimidazole synthase [Chelatococcus sp. HY11]MBX3537038.1 5,6-dimethylbenzimidazole synthase [Chelatococcus sp.]MBX3545986.1 5,6-dimethylbenzimidazole synthase [Chelatococcus sp.]MCO5079613.1 5,6-dimethylbenzimidazole synthase [Chelatococcus sp.]